MKDKIKEKLEKEINRGKLSYNKYEVDDMLELIYQETLKAERERIKEELESLIGKEDDCDKGKEIDDVWFHGSDIIKILKEVEEKEE